MREPMLALLLGGGVVYLALGDLQEALILLAFARSPSSSLSCRRRAPSGCWKRCAISPARARSLSATASAGGSRAGKSCVGILSCFPRATACPLMRVLLQANDLQADESLLTGESVPVRKVARSAVRS